MRESLIEVVVGALVLAVAAGFVVYAVQTTGATGLRGGHYQLTASFRSVSGVSVGTDVRLAGVRVGEVTDLELDPETFRADARYTVRDGIRIPADSAIVISSEGLLGGNYVEIMPGGSPENLKPGEAIEDTQGAVSLLSLLSKFVSSTGG